MKPVRRVAFAAVSLATVFAVTAITPPAQATDGVMVLTANRTLAKDHKGTIVVQTDGVTLDCGSSRVIGKGARGAGINLTGRQGVKVRNCAITGFVDGIVLVDSHGNNFDEVTVDGATGAGCSLLRSNQNLFVNSTFSNNIGGGCEFVESHFNIFERNVVTDNVEEGIDLELSNNNTFTANEVSSNDSDGFDLEQSHGNDIVDNVIVGNIGNGVELDLANDNAIDFNQVVSNGTTVFRNGITLDGSLRNRIHFNVSNANGRDGVRISDLSNNNVITLNKACNNGSLDGNWDSGTGNTFEGNTFCRKSPNIP